MSKQIHVKSFTSTPSPPPHPPPPPALRTSSFRHFGWPIRTPPRSRRGPCRRMRWGFADPIIYFNKQQVVSETNRLFRLLNDDPAASPAPLRALMDAYPPSVCQPEWGGVCADPAATSFASLLRGGAVLKYESLLENPLCVLCFSIIY